MPRRDRDPMNRLADALVERLKENRGGDRRSHAFKVATGREEPTKVETLDRTKPPLAKMKFLRGKPTPKEIAFLRSWRPRSWGGTGTRMQAWEVHELTWIYSSPEDQALVSEILFNSKGELTGW